MAPELLARLIAEHSDLKDKLAKLDAFIAGDAFAKIDPSYEAMLILRQSMVMRDYRIILEYRLTLYDVLF